MSLQRLLVTAGVAACAVLAPAITAPAVLGSGDSADDGADPGTAGLSPGAQATTGVADKPRATTSPPPAGGDRGAGAPGEMTTATPDTATGPPGSRDGRSSATPLVPMDLPEPASGGESLVPGYPEDVIPAVPGSAVSTNSVSPSGDRLQVVLVASVDREPDAVMRFYRTMLGRIGLRESHARAGHGSSAAAFAHGDSSVVVTAMRGRTRTTYSVFATLSPSGT
jgi:hypothetical protein